ncbi:TPA: tyrosine-type recombinase/integrase [Klebsiella aerogenes]|nr:tyrosine-type recombinase/integrase [Klebsiella aerogenes]
MQKRKYLTRQEISRMEAATAEGRYAVRDRCLVRMCFMHGFRVSELCSLRLSDIDLEARSIYIRRLKNGFSTIHPLTREELPLLLAWLYERDAWRNADSPFVFLSQKKGSLSRSYVRDIFCHLGEKAGLSVRVHPHMLRHACGYALADLGADTRLIQDYLGHRNISHTVIYTAANPARFTNIWKRPS